MKKRTNILLSWSIVLLIFISSSSDAFCQFEQKLTVNASGSFSYPDMLQDFSSYGNGIGFDGGLQYNINRSLSYYGSARFYYMFGAADYSEAYYSNLAFAGGLKLNLLPRQKINPYLFGEANINLIWLEEYGYANDSYTVESGTSIGGLGGVGIDFKLNDNLSIFIQSGAYYTWWDNRLNSHTQLGVRINMIKSKTI